jgi:hypothetical protein
VIIFEQLFGNYPLLQGGENLGSGGRLVDRVVALKMIDLEKISAVLHPLKSSRYFDRMRAKINIDSRLLLNLRGYILRNFTEISFGFFQIFEVVIFCEKLLR